MNLENLQKTALYDEMLKADGKMVDFFSWALPIHFGSIIAEHKAVRENCGMFDVSHMGQIFVEGKDAYKFVQSISTNNIKNFSGAGVYSHIPNNNGGVIDDVINFCLTPEKFLIIVNAATQEKDYEWFLEKSKGLDVKITNESKNHSMLAVQGPKAMGIIEKIEPKAVELKRFGILACQIFGEDCFITRTGYTGEDGVEIIMPHSIAPKIWQTLLDYDVKPCGLGARDILRLEAGYLLYGADIDDEHSPIEAGYGWVVKLKNDREYPSKEIFAKQKEEGVKIKLTGFKVSGGVPRPGSEILYNGNVVGKLTSGVFSPLFKGIGVGYIPADLPSDAEFEIDFGTRKGKAEIVKMPFYQNKV